MITDKDITKLKITFATKDDIKDLVTITELNKTLEQYATKSDIVSFKDALLFEIKKIRDEIALVIGYKDQIEDHETRIDKLEKVAFPD